ncbi:MAG: hypothetical protein EZS28_009991 [Streblomastix strix]|uniref:Uncharacterized protein n=1 Tax=Streblomastix strix TaxID=222440 RepID=A0A5J4WJK2_9EUKA|nr:MAG: hypothetical protein EZS28_009991 [Streblomastix strix]
MSIFTKSTSSDQRISNTLSSGENADVLDEFNNSIGQIKGHEKDSAFLKRFLQLIVIGFTSKKAEMTEIIKTTSLAGTLLQILKNLSAHEENEQVIITAILCSIGALERVKQMAFQAQKDGHACGGDFIIWGESQEKLEELQRVFERSQQEISKQKGQNQEDIKPKEQQRETLVEESDTLRKEMEGFKNAALHKEMKNINQQQSNENEDLILASSDIDTTDKDGKKKKSTQKENEKQQKKDKDNEKELKGKKLKETEKEKDKLDKDKIKAQKGDQSKTMILNESAKLRKIEEEEEEKAEEIIPLKPRLIKHVFEKGVFRVSNKFKGSDNSRRFGFIADGEELFNNIPVQGKNFRAITYDEKKGIIRLGWQEIFRWIPTKAEYRITFEVDLREDAPNHTLRIFYEYEESPILFVNVPKQLKIYLAHDNLPGTKYENIIFQIPKPTKEKTGEYERLIDYNMDLSK